MKGLKNFPKLYLHCLFLLFFTWYSLTIKYKSKWLFWMGDVHLLVHLLQCEKCQNTEFSLVRIFLYLDWIEENTDQIKLRIWTLFMQYILYFFALCLLKNFKQWIKYKNCSIKRTSHLEFYFTRSNLEVADFGLKVDWMNQMDRKTKV